MQLTINRVAAALVAVAMIAGLAFAFTASRAQALTLSELVELFIALEVIPADKADEARAVLDGQDEEAAPSMACEFTRDLSVGDMGADVMDLQKLLNANGFPVAASGVGSAGMETDYYGSMTAGAVAAMQEAYASDILAPLGLTAGTGYFGASTRAVANTLCADEAPDAPDAPEDEEEMDEEEDMGDLSGEASLQVFEIQTADDDELEEGAEDAVVAELEVQFEDGDAVLERMDISLVFSGTDNGDETEPWDVFESVSLWVDGDKVAEEDADDEDEYLDEDNGVLRLSGLDIVGYDDESVDILVAVSLMGSLDLGSDDESEWEVAVEEVRYEDAEGVNTVDDDSDEIGDAVTFTIEEEGAEDELIVKSNSSDPDSSIIKVEDDSKSDWVTVFVFDLDTDDSVNDIVLDMVPVRVTVDSGEYFDYVDDARLVIDGVEIDSSSDDVATTSGVGVIDFDVDKDVEIDAGDRVEAELQLRFLSLDSADEGRMIMAEVNSSDADDIQAEGADDLTDSQTSGSATGEWHQLYTAGVFAEIVSTDTDAEGTDGDIGVFTIKFDLTAFEGDYFVEAVASSTATTGVFYSLDGPGGATLSDSATLTSTADEPTAGVFEVVDGQTETFTLKVNVDSDTDGDVRLQLEQVLYGASAADAVDSGAVESHTASPDEDFRTDYQLIAA